jgi:hypothetical protein
VSRLASGQEFVLSDRQRFQDVRELERLLLKDEWQFGRNLTAQPIVGL